MENADWTGLFTGVLGMAIGLFLIALSVAWIVLPFVVIAKLGSMNQKIEHARKSAQFAVEHLTRIEDNTASVAKFFNERDVKVE
jgi:uncharacterized membrane protein YhiD involved in acid resistance